VQLINTEDMAFIGVDQEFRKQPPASVAQG